MPSGVAPATLAGVVLEAARRGAPPALRAGDGTLTSFAELGSAAREVAGGLIALGIRPGDAVALLSDTRAEWTVADCGALCAGAVVVPVYQTNSPEECRYVLAHSGARVVICEDASQLEKVQAVRAELPDLEHVFTVVPVDGVPSLADLRARAAEAPAGAVEAAAAAVGPEDVATIVYTSGTTGPPKGCVLTHANVVATMRAYEQQVDLRPGVVIFMFLPLAHALARVVQFVSLDAGGTLAFWSGDPRRLLDDLAAARPTHFPSVPRVFEKAYARALVSREEASPLRRRIFDWALATGTRYRAAARAGGAGPLLRARHALADRLVLGRVRTVLGGRVELGLTGAAPIGREVLEFFDACGILVLEGFGMTESCAAATLNTVDAFRFGTVGRPLPGAEVRTAEDGEVLLRGPMVFRGYHRDDAATADVLRDGWLRTGDLGELDADGFLAITGRKKDIIITSSGKNVTPTNIESALRDSRWVSQAVVYGDNHSYLVALLTLDPDELDALRERTGADGDAAALAADPHVLAAIRADVDAANRRFARVEQVKRFGLLDHDLSQEGGELTPTMKVKRGFVYERYRARFEALYDET